ncbi:MAG: DUF4469 domain-containing protein [Tannerella sp.]|jgi:hypothetical protein|nr:DUF4469 domain-containing protein [Tannerella sp.]
MKKYFWKVWLRPNLLTKDVDNDYVAEVSTVGKTLRNADVARLFIESGSELQYETLLDILDRADRIRREKLQEGSCVQTGICHLSPRVAGSWLGATTAYNPDAHKITLDIVPTAEMRTALADVGVEVLGIREGGAYIGLVTDVTTGLTDGTLTPGGQIIIAGDKIKVEPSTGGAGEGVFLTDGKDIYSVAPLAVNHPKEVIAVAPQLQAGTYTLYIVTRYAGGNTLLKEPRRITYATPLTIT